jgi:hypothetical protein
MTHGCRFPLSGMWHCVNVWVVPTFQKITLFHLQSQALHEKAQDGEGQKMQVFCSLFSFSWLLQLSSTISRNDITDTHIAPVDASQYQQRPGQSIFLMLFTSLVSSHYPFHGHTAPFVLFIHTVLLLTKYKTSSTWIASLTPRFPAEYQTVMIKLG